MFLSSKVDFYSANLISIFLNYMKNFNKIWIKGISIVEFFKKEKIYGTKKLNFSKIKLNLRGFYSIGQVPFDFNKFSYNDFISDYENIKLSYLNYPYGRLLRDKILFSIYFKNFRNLPDIYALFDKGRIFSISREHTDISVQKLLEILE